MKPFSDEWYAAINLMIDRANRTVHSCCRDPKLTAFSSRLDRSK